MLGVRPWRGKTREASSASVPADSHKVCVSSRKYTLLPQPRSLQWSDSLMQSLDDVMIGIKKIFGEQRRHSAIMVPFETPRP